MYFCCYNNDRAISYKLATKRGVNDGQNDEDRIRRERFSRPRLFQFIKRNTIYDNFTSRSRKIHPSKKKQDHYDVIARRFISPWNEHLSIGMTQEQITADDMIIRGTRIEKNYDGIPLRCTFCLENIVIEKQISTNENLSLATKDILNILRIASRGKFLSKYKGPNTKDENCSAAQHDSFAPWFHPDEWFSLSAYLVNCFETSLWERFALVKSHRDTTEVTTLTNPSNHHPIVGIMNTLSDERIERALLDSVKMALKETLQNHDSSKLTRDHILWNLLKESVHLTFNQKILFNNSVHEKLNSLKQRVKKSILSTPLIEIGTSIDVFTTCTQKHLQNALAAAAETQLLNNVNTICPPIKNNSNENTTATSNKKKRKKKKKKLKHRQSNVVKESQQEEASQIENNDTIDEDPIPPTTVDEDEKNNSMDVMQTFSIQPPVSIQRNKNTIVALMIVDDVLEKVCEKLGFVTEKGSKDAINQNLNEVDDAKYTIISHEKKASSARDNTQLIIKQKAKTRIRPPEKAVSKRKDAHYHPKQSKAEVTISQPKAISNEHNKTTNLLIDRGRQTGWPRLNDTLENFDYTSSPIIALQSNRQEKPETIAYRTDPHNQPHYQSLVASTEHFNYLHPHGSYRDIAVPSYFDASTLKASGAFDGWLGVKHLQRQNSLLADFFTDDTKDRNENLIASSTAASIASSSGDDEDEDLVDEKSHDEDSNSTSNFNDVEEAPTNSDFKLDSCTNIDSNLILEPLSKSKSPSISSTSNSTHSKQLSIQLLENIPSNSGNKPSRSSPSSGLRTPPPRSSPLLISLADLPRFRKRGTSVEQRKKFDKQPTKKNHLVSGSLPSSPIASSPNMVGSTWSPDDLPLKSSTGKKKFHLTKEMFNKGKGSFRLLRKSFLQVASSSAHDLSKFSDSGESLQNSTHHRKRKTNHGVQKLPAVSIPDADFELGTSYALSDGAFENHEGEISSQHRDNDNITTTKDGTTTISSAAPDMEDINILREERNAYRDMCLTLGAEVAKLKNLLSSERGTSMHPMMLYPTTPMKPYCFNSSYDPEFMAPFFHGTKAAMSDAGVQRHDHDSIRSEDGTDIVQGTIGGAESVGLSWIGHHSGGNNMRGTPTGTGTYVGSDSSVGQMGSLISGGFRPLNRDSLWSTPFHGLQSRLSKDIYNFLEKISIQLNKQDIKRKSAIDRLSKMVTALWPRAQIKIYGSHVSNLCLPSSDLDFVICLPAVHKNAPAAAAGVLEGRNAINETWQKLLARKLKGESWIDPRSIKLIERTVVPVIKVSTKDKKSDVLQLDISFDGPGHHGLEAVQMVTEVMQVSTFDVSICVPCF